MKYTTCSCVTDSAMDCCKGHVLQVQRVFPPYRHDAGLYHNHVNSTKCLSILYSHHSMRSVLNAVCPYANRQQAALLTHHTSPRMLDAAGDKFSFCSCDPTLAPSLSCIHPPFPRLNYPMGRPLAYRTDLARLRHIIQTMSHELSHTIPSVYYLSVASLTATYRDFQLRLAIRKGHYNMFYIRVSVEGEIKKVVWVRKRDIRLKLPVRHRCLYRTPDGTCRLF